MPRSGLSPTERCLAYRRAVTEIQEFAALRVMMRRDAYMTEAHCRRWFELWQRYELMRG